MKACQALLKVRAHAGKDAQRYPLKVGPGFAAASVPWKLPTGGFTGILWRAAVAGEGSLWVVFCIF